MKIFALRAGAELERKRTEERLRLFHELMNKTDDALFAIDPDTARIIDVNERAVSRLGYSREELMSMRIPDISVGMENPQVWKDRMASLKRQGFMMFDTSHRRKDGTLFPVEVNANFTIRGEKTFVIAVARETRLISARACS